MKGRRRITRAWGALRHLRRSQDGATLVEYGLAIALMLLILFSIIDFGRMLFHYVAAEKAVQAAARVAAVRPPPANCSGLPTVNTRGTTAITPPPRFGTSCGAGADYCANPGPVTCTASTGDPTSEEVWQIVRGTLPTDATISSIAFRYDYDPALGFIGGPYVPVVTVELTGLQFRFAAPLGQLAALVVGSNVDPDAVIGGAIDFPALSASMPGEDLAMGTSG